MTTGLYRVYTKGDGYAEPIRKWQFIAGFVEAEDAQEWVHGKVNSLYPLDERLDGDIFYKITFGNKTLWNTESD